MLGTVPQYLALWYPIVLPSVKLASTSKNHPNVSLCVNDFIFHSLSAQGSKREKKQFGGLTNREAAASYI